MYHKWKSHDVCFLKYKAQQTEFFLILEHFLLFYPPKNLKNQSFEKMKKKTPEDIIILHLQTTSDDHMMYGSWDMEWDRILIILDYFCSFTPLTTQKTKILKKWKNAHRYYHFTHLYHKWKSCDVWFLRYEAWQT